MESFVPLGIFVLLGLNFQTSTTAPLSQQEENLLACEIRQPLLLNTVCVGPGRIWRILAVESQYC
jgi:hypothetical protein